jgi:hypothetical protein
MAFPPDPISQAFRLVLRDPAIWLTEIVWRWSFGAIAFLLLFFSVLSLLGSAAVNPMDAAAWRSNSPTVMAQALVNMLLQSGPNVLKTAAWLLPVITLLWTVLGAAGRAVTLTRLTRSEVSFLSILALQGSRALVMWLAGALWIGAMVLDAHVSTNGPQTDQFLYYALAFWSVVLIGGSWAAANWYLSLAAICCLRSGQGFLKGTGQAVRLARAQGGEFGGIGLVFAVFRLVALLIAFVLCVLPSGLMATAPRSYTAWVITVSLAYFAVGDFLYISRMATYLIAASPGDEAAATGGQHRRDHGREIYSAIPPST